MVIEAGLLTLEDLKLLSSKVLLVDVDIRFLYYAWRILEENDYIVRTFSYSDHMTLQKSRSDPHPPVGATIYKERTRFISN